MNEVSGDMPVETNFFGWGSRLQGAFNRVRGIIPHNREWSNRLNDRLVRQRSTNLLDRPVIAHSPPSACQPRAFGHFTDHVLPLQR